MITLGIDPGKSGAIAALDIDGHLISVCDLPYLDGAVSAPVLARLALELGDGDRTCWVERAQPMPRQGVTSSFNYGTGYGVVLGVLGAFDIPHQTVRPTVWKKRSGLAGKDKAASRRRAIELWPADADLFARVKDDGRAEACLIARFGWLADRGALTPFTTAET